MSYINKIATGLNIGAQALYAAKSSSMADIATELDKMDLPAFEEKEANATNKLDIYRSSNQLYNFHSNLLRQAIGRTSDSSELLPYGDPQRDFMLATFAKLEPILSGAIYSMSVKMSSLSWTVIGRKNLATYFASVLDDALSINSIGWGDFISSTTQDFNTLDRGTFWHTPRIGSNLTGRLGSLVYMDPLACGMTGNMQQPVFYSSNAIGQDLYFKPGEFAHFASMVSPREEHFGIGFSSTARAYRSARILYGLGNYDWQKLNNLPPEGVAAVSGLTADEFRDSLEIWRVARESNRSLTYPQVLWLLGNQPNTNVDVKFVGFSQLPEAFNRKDVVDQYVNVLALVFGVDAREFWPVSTSSMGTAAESEIQHMKARGKGHAELITMIERYFNSEMPDGVEFAFDTQDVAEDQIAASIAKGWVDAFMPLYNPGGKGTPPSKTPTAPGVDRPEGGASQSNLPQPEGGGSDVEPLIDKNQFLRLLIDRRVLPNWLVTGDDRIIRTDLGQEEKQSWWEGDGNSPVILEWKEGKLKMSRQPAYELIGQIQPNSRSISYAAIIPQNAPENASRVEFGGSDDALDAYKETKIKGKPIPQREALRGPRPTRTTVQAEMELWRNTPELAAYVATPDEPEYEQVLEKLTK